MRPMLCAIYMQTRVGEEKEDEPCMLLYADDMVVWADTEKELRLKLESILSSMGIPGIKAECEQSNTLGRKDGNERITNSRTLHENF